MTREEAIRRFQRMKNILSIPNSDASRAIEAIDMAIEALQREDRFLKSMDTNEPLYTEVVRCKDCRYSHMTYDGDCKYCDKWKEDGEALYLDGDFYCAYGERKESE